VHFLSELGAAQALPIGLLLLLSGGLKALRSVHLVHVERTVFALLARSRLSLLMLWRGLGVLELLLGAGLLLLPGRALPAALAAAQLTAASLYLAWSRRRAPGKSCGCMGSRSSEAVSGRTIARAAALAGAALCAALTGAGWLAALRSPVVALGLFGELAALLWLFPELGTELRRSRPQAGAGAMLPDCATAPDPGLAVLESGLKRSQVWATTRAYLTSEVHSEQWREGCYHFFCYPAEYAQAPATAVYAAPIGLAAADYRVALVEEQSQAVLLQLPGQAPGPPHEQAVIS
jgi:hypothetical protein